VQAAAFPTIFPLVLRVRRSSCRSETMPGWLQAFVKVNPITLVTDSVRALALGEPFEPASRSLVWAAVADGRCCLAVFVPLSVPALPRS
jgi:hypothetical protein